MSECRLDGTFPEIQIARDAAKRGRERDAGRDVVVLERELAQEALDGLGRLALVYEVEAARTSIARRRRNYRLLRSATENTAARLRSALASAQETNEEV